MHKEAVEVMEEKKTGFHHITIENRKKGQFTGIRDVISFDEKEVILETVQGILTIKGSQLHVNRLTVEEGKLDLEGKMDSFVYQESDTYRKSGESFFRRLLR